VALYRTAFGSRPTRRCDIPSLYLVVHYLKALAVYVRL